MSNTKAETGKEIVDLVMALDKADRENVVSYMAGMVAGKKIREAREAANKKADTTAEKEE